MILQYLSGNGDSAVFTVTTQGKSTQYTIPDKKYKIIQVTGSVNISVPGAGQADFSNDDVCLCTRQYGAPSFYLQRIAKIKKIIQSTFVGDGNYDNIMKSINRDGKQPFKYMDYLYVAFADIDDSSPDSPKIYFRTDWEPKVKTIIAEAQKENPNLIIFAQFNWASYLAPLVEDPNKAYARIDAFAKSIPPFLKQYGFRGIDFDWESVPTKLDTDKASYLFKQVKNYIGSGACLSVSADNITSFDSNILNQYVDIVNVQSYQRLNMIDDFIKFGITSEKIYVGICSENDGGFYPPNGDISAYTGCVTDKGLPGLYAWRIDNDNTDHDLNVPRYTITKGMWKYTRGVDAQL